MNTGPREWDAQTYDRVSDPQYHWGLEVLDRLDLKGDEYVMDAGCGSGRVTAKLLEKLPDGRVLCVDASESMIEVAREAIGDRADYLVTDLAELEVDEPVDLTFSTATFHWLPDHDRLFSRLHAAIRPGGRLVAQCGGAGNVAEHAKNIVAVATRPEFAEHFQDMSIMWNFATPEETEERLERGRLRPGALLARAQAGAAGRSLCVHDHGDHGPPPGPAARGEASRLRRGGARSRGGTRSTLNYVRLNIDARRA